MVLDIILKFGLGAAPLVVGYLLFDKSESWGKFLVLFGVICIIALITSEIAYNHNKLANEHKYNMSH